jgi:hypothetical protein
MMHVLPNDIIDHIYKLKHSLELKDVHDELIDNYEYTIRKIISLKNLFLNMNMEWYEPITLLKIYTAMRNEGYLHHTAYDDILFNLLTMNNTMSDSIKYDTSLSFTCILNEFEDFIDDALRQQDLADDWINHNVR